MVFFARLSLLLVLKITAFKFANLKNLATLISIDTKKEPIKTIWDPNFKMSSCTKSSKLRLQNIPNDSSLTGCSLELCNCQYYAEIAECFVPFHFGTYNTSYEPKMYHADGTECGCDEYSVAGMYKKLPRNCDLGAFDSGVHIKLPPNKIVWEPNDGTSVYHPVCKPLECCSRGVLGPFSHIKLFLKHHHLNKIYRPPKDQHLCQNLPTPT